nr:SpaA isopeptide-forming pilin-related protein [Clostridium paraputrificum]
MSKLKKIFKKGKKRIVSTIMLSMMVIGLIPVEAMALVIHQEGGFIHDFYFRDLSKNMNMKTKIKKDEYGNYVYCMDAMLQAPNGDDLTDGELLDDGAYRILKNGYPNRSITGDSRKDYVITQSAFWAYVDPANFKFENMIGYSYGARDTEMERLAKELYNTGVNGTDSQTINVNFSQTDLEAVFDGSNYVTPYFQVNVTGALNQARFRIQMKTTVDGVKYQLKDGSFVDEVPMNTEFRVVIPKGAKEGSVALRADGKVSGARVVVYKSSRNDIQDVARWTDYEVHENSKDLANITWNIKGNLELTKINDFGELLDGAKFALKDITNGSIVTEAITAGGKLIFNNVESGLYDLVELEAAPGHVNNFKPQRVEVLPSNNTTKVEIENETIKGRIKVIKSDIEAGELLAGAEFDLIEKATGKVVEKLITGADGTTTSGLHRFGEYILKEVKAPNKYTLDGKEYFVTISEHMKTIEITHKNRIIKGRIEINKEDSEIPGLKLEGVKFGIFDSKNTLVEELITDTKGYAISGLLNYGDYTIRELETKNGYLLSKQEWKVEIREDGKTLTYNIQNDVIKGKIQIVKLDADNAEKPVKGAVFGVYAKNVFGIDKDTLVDTITTDENGFAFTKDLRFGEYYIKELSVGDDYWLNGNKYPVTITEHGKIEVVHIKNEPVKMKLRVVKYDSENKEAIKGAKFKVVNRVTGEEVEFTEFFGGIIPYKKTIFTTNKEGEILFPQSLPYGKYELVETNPAEGFNPIEPIPFEITRDTKFEEIDLLGKVTTIEVGNIRIKGNMELLKVDSETKEPMEGIEFKVTALDGFMKGQTWNLTSNEEGKVSLKDLEYGKYRIDEVKTHWNYVLNTQPIFFEITENGKTVEVEMTNKKIRGSVELLKVDKDTQRPLEGAEFELWNGEKLVGTYVTDKDGKIVVENLEAGKYYFVEVKAPEHYEINQDVALNFEILEDGQKVEILAENKVEEGELLFEKTDISTGEVLDGAVIKIEGLDEHNKHISFEFVSSKDGNKLKLPVGRYKFTETTAPNGYEIAEESGEFEILKDEVIKCKLDNKKIEMPKTGDTAPIVLIGGMLILSLAVVVMLRNKEANN